MILSPEPTIHPSAKIRDCQLGAWTQIGEDVHLNESTVDNYTYIMQHCQVIYSHIGKFCSIASFVRLHPVLHPLERPTTHHFTYRAEMFGFGEDEADFFDWRRSKAVHIGHDVWIGHNASVMPGVKVGNGAVIGTGAVVTKDVEPYTVVVGVPAKPIRRRFGPQIAERLEALAWWEWPHEQVKEGLADFRGNVEAFLEKYEGVSV